MSDRMPPEIAEAAVASGVNKVEVGVGKLFVGSFLAGAYIAFGGLVAIAVSSGLNPQQWGSLPTLFTGAAFTLGLVLVLIAGSHLLTGNMLLIPIGAMQGRLTWGDILRNFTLVLIGNLAGALFVAYFLAVQTGVIGHLGSEAGTSGAMTYDRLAQIAQAKALHESSWQIFLRA